MPKPRQLPKHAWPHLFKTMYAIAAHWPAEGTHEAIAFSDRQVWDRASHKLMLSYFIRNAMSERTIRDSVKKPSAKRLTDSQFQLTPLEIPVDHFLTLLDYDPVRRRVFYGLGRTFIEQEELKILAGNALAIASDSWKLLSTIQVPNAPIDVEFQRDSFRLTLIGGLGENTQSSEVIEFTPVEKGWLGVPILNELVRSVGSRSGDFDGDGNGDVLVVGFGDNEGSGELAIYWGNKASKSFTKQVLFPGSGPVGAEVADFDGDGRLDILVLIAQHRQQLRLYLNRGERQFEQRVLIQRPIGWGYMDFEVVDFDSDGDLDVVTVAGNNMEFGTPPLKPYHGVRVWINNGAMVLSEKYFYPLYGAGQCAVVDVDGDGDLDIAATSFTADWEAESPEAFVLLVQTDSDPMAFQPYHAPQSLQRRWTFLAKGDQKKDGATRLFVAHSWMPFGAPKHLRSEFEKELEQPSHIYVLDFNAALRVRN